MQVVSFYLAHNVLSRIWNCSFKGRVAKFSLSLLLPCAVLQVAVSWMFLLMCFVNEVKSFGGRQQFLFSSGSNILINSAMEERLQVKLLKK
jgi:hypothetical protein